MPDTLTDYIIFISLGKLEVDSTQDGLPQLRDLAWPIQPPTFTTGGIGYSLCVLNRE